MRRQKVNNLEEAFVSVEALVDWKYSGESSKKNNNRKEDRDRRKKRKFDKKKGKHIYEKSFEKSNNGNFEKKDEGSSSKKTRFSDGCCICKGPHIARNCPKHRQLSSLLGDASKEEDHEKEQTPPRVGTIKLLNAMNSEGYPAY